MIDYSKHVARVANGENVKLVAAELRREFERTGAPINWEGARLSAAWLRGQANAIDALANEFEPEPIGPCLRNLIVSNTLLAVCCLPGKHAGVHGGGYFAWDDQTWTETNSTTGERETHPFAENT